MSARHTRDGTSIMQRLLHLPERYPARIIAACTLAFLMAYGSSLIWLPKPDGRILVGDALHHYVQLRSLVFDGDLRFTNEYVRLYGLKGGEAGTEWVYGSTPTGYVRNMMPIGPALLWAPLFLCLAFGVWAASALGSTYPLDGYARLFQASAGLTGVLAAGLGTWLAYRAATTICSARAAIFSTLGLWLSSSAIYYSVISPTYSHAASMLAVSAFWFVWLRTLSSHQLSRYAMLGALCGAAALMRWQDALLLVVPCIDATWHVRQSGIQKWLSRIAVCVLCAAIAFSPQMLVWATLYGAPLTIPQGGDFMRWGSPALVAVLFDDHHGLLSWTPIIALALAGFVPLIRRAPVVGVAAIVFFAASWYVNAAASDWWAGEAFGSRRFLSCFPIFVLAFAALLDRWRVSAASAAAIAAVFTGLTFLLLLQYQMFMHGRRDIAPYPSGLDGLWFARFRVPFDLLVDWLGR